MKIGIDITADSGPGILHELSGVIARHNGNILSVEIIDERSREDSDERLREDSNIERSRGDSNAARSRGTRTVFEIELAEEPAPLLAALGQLPVVHHAAQVETMQSVYGKRIIIVGGGAQVGQVALGAIAEADRHNIRGEHISVDTIPLVGEKSLAAAVRASARLPRVKAIVLAGSLMGGEIEVAVREVRAAGLLVVSLNMAGSVPDSADLVVTDPVQAGVMTVMAVADTAKFTIERLKRRVF
jgi:energy-converting hydrogenase B subunit Q